MKTTHGARNHSMKRNIPIDCLSSLPAELHTSIRWTRHILTDHSHWRNALGMPA